MMVRGIARLLILVLLVLAAPSGPVVALPERPPCSCGMACCGVTEGACCSLCTPPVHHDLAGLGVSHGGVQAAGHCVRTASPGAATAGRVRLASNPLPAWHYKTRPTSDRAPPVFLSRS